MAGDRDDNLIPEDLDVCGGQMVRWRLRIHKGSEGLNTLSPLVDAGAHGRWRALCSAAAADDLAAFEQAGVAALGVWWSQYVTQRQAGAVHLYNWRALMGLVP